jgi:hypothetical protein
VEENSPVREHGSRCRSVEPINENARDFRPWRFPDVLVANWITIARQLWMGLRVSPPPASNCAAAGVQSASFPASRTFALISPSLQVTPNPRLDNRFSVRPRVTPIAAPSGLAYGESPGRPGPSLRLRRPPADLRISPAIVPSGYTGWLLFGSRPEAHPPASPSMRLRVSPAPASTAGSMINPAKPELCIHRRSRGMNLRVQSGVAYSSNSGYLPDLASSFHLPDWPACETAQRNRACIVLPESNCLPNSLQVHQLESELRADESVNASAKFTLICGFHKLWCISQEFLLSQLSFYAEPRKQAPVSHLSDQLCFFPA